MQVETNEIDDAAVTPAKISGSDGFNGQVLTISEDGTPQWAGRGGSSGWSLTGNAGTASGTNFIGTTDTQSVQVRVNSVRVMQWTRGAIGFDSQNLLGGYSGNTVREKVRGATISGGGEITNVNDVGGDFGTIGGGRGNTSSGPLSVVAGGEGNESHW